MNRTTIRTKLSQIRDGYLGLEINQRLYINAIVILIIFFASKSILSPQNTRGLLFIFIAFWVAAIAFDLTSLYKKVYETILGKGISIIVFSLCTNFAIVLSSQIINTIVKVNPVIFPHTIALLSILSIPIFFVAGFGILYLALLITTPFFFMFHTLPDKEAKMLFIPGYSETTTIAYLKTTRIVQLISISVFCGVVVFSSQKITKSYEVFLTETGRTFLYHWEMYPKTSCDLSPGKRAAFLGDNKLLVAEKKGSEIIFEVQECNNGT